MSAPMLLWHFREAPLDYRELSSHGGDEDWLLMVPVGVEPPDWATSFGRWSISTHPLPSGATVYIGAHS